MSLTGTLRLPHEGRTVVEPGEDIVDLAKGRPMASSLECTECDPPQVFTGSGAWSAYASHIGNAHPEPSGREMPPVPGRRKEAPVPSTKQDLTCPKCGRDDFTALKGRKGHERYCTGEEATKPTVRASTADGNGATRAVVEPIPIQATVEVPAVTTVTVEAGSATITDGQPAQRRAGSIHHGGSIPGFIGFDAMADDLEAAEKALLEAIAKPLHVRFENGYSVAWVDVEEIEVLVQGQRVIYLTAEDRDAVHDAEARLIETHRAEYDALLAEETAKEASAS